MAHIAIVHIPDHTADPAIVAADIEVNAGARVVGVFVYPTKSEPTCLGGCVKGRGWGRDKGGWMKCGGCGRRNPKVRRWLINALFDLLGANLYPEAPAAFRTPEGYGQ